MSSDKVGYKSPPTRTRFRAGVSGNPSGRPRRRPTFGEVLLTELATPISGTKPEQGHNKMRALIKTLVDSAIAGNARAQSVVVAALARIGDADAHESPALTPDDQDILEAFVGGELQRRTAEADASKPKTEPPADGEDGRRPDADDQQNR